MWLSCEYRRVKSRKLYLFPPSVGNASCLHVSLVFRCRSSSLNVHLCVCLFPAADLFALCIASLFPLVRSLHDFFSPSQSCVPCPVLPSFFPCLYLPSLLSCPPRCVSFPPSPSLSPCLSPYHAFHLYPAFCLCFLWSRCCTYSLLTCLAPFFFPSHLLYPFPYPLFCRVSPLSFCQHIYLSGLLLVSPCACLSPGAWTPSLRLCGVSQSIPHPESFSPSHLSFWDAHHQVLHPKNSKKKKTLCTIPLLWWRKSFATLW